MVTDSENIQNDGDLVHLSAKNFTVKISRSLLKSSSFFFNAAFKSGMVETKSRKFSLPDFSDRQLKHLHNFLLNFDILTANISSTNEVSNNNKAPTERKKCDCLCEEKMRRIVESTLVADYLQMPPFKEKLVDFFSTLLNSTYSSFSSSSSSCLSAGHSCNIFTYSFPVFSDCRLRCLRKTLLNFFYRFPLTYLSPRYLNVDISQSFVVNQICRWLSDDRIFIGSEDDILSTILEWMEIPHKLKKRRLSADSVFNVLSVLATAIRPGLLTPYGLRCLHSLIFENLYSDNADLSSKLHSVKTLLALNFRSSFQTVLCSSSSHLDLLKSISINELKPRASTPVLFILSRPTSPFSNFAFYFIELAHGQVITIDMPESLKSTLFSDPIENNPIHMCTAEIRNCQNLVFIFIHQINTGTIKGCVLDLSTLEAERLPSLDLKHDSFSWAAEQLPTTFSLPHTVGVVYTSDGLMVFCSFILASDSVLCVYRFDAKTWSWVKYIPYMFNLNLRDPGLKGFTPMPKATRQGDQWLYGTLNLSIGSQFVRVRPSKCDNNSIEVERLHSPSFLVRAYCLVGVDIAMNNSELVKSYIFPFHACSRDNLALNTCFCLESGSWKNWDQMDSSTSSSMNDMNFGFSRRHVGFSGVVCTSSLTLPHLTKDFKTSNDCAKIRGTCSSQTTKLPSHYLASSKSSLVISPSSSITDMSETNYRVPSSSDPDNGTSDPLKPGAYLVLAGSLAQSADLPEPRSSGIWIIDPSRHVAKPTFLLSSELESLLYRLDGYVATVALANWSAIIKEKSKENVFMPARPSVLSVQKTHLISVTDHMPSGAGSDSD